MRIRSFVALPLSVALTRRLVDEVAHRRAALGAAAQEVSWVPAANLHVTVKFLGGIQEEAAGAIRDRLRRCVANLAPVELRLSGFGAFPGTAEARVLWAAVSPTPALLTLAAAVEAELVDFGLDPEAQPTSDGRPYHLHVTVGRLRRAPEASAHVALGSFFGDVSIGNCAANELVLYESRTPKAGVEYLRLGQMAIGSSAAKPPRSERDVSHVASASSALSASSKET